MSFLNVNLITRAKRIIRHAYRPFSWSWSDGREPCAARWTASPNGVSATTSRSHHTPLTRPRPCRTPRCPATRRWRSLSCRSPWTSDTRKNHVTTDYFGKGARRHRSRTTYMSFPSAGPDFRTSDTAMDGSPFAKCGLSRPPLTAIPNP